MHSPCKTKRNVAIDVLRCIAAIVITNSHMEILYGKYSYLATGGSVGDALFFFCSGFTLFLGSQIRFDNWYKKRIRRIYPTIFAWAIISLLVFDNSQSIGNVIINGGGWFVSCILIYYVVIYLIHKFLPNHLDVIIWIILLGCGLWFFMKNLSMDFTMYGETYFKWFYYFVFMVYGAKQGLNVKTKFNASTNVALLIFGLISFYSIFFLSLNHYINFKFQYFSLFPLMLIVASLYRLCKTRAIEKLYNSKIIGWLIKFIGGLCLEIYLVQYSLFTNIFNSIFPFNILLMFVIIVVCAYLLRCFARLIAQTFEVEAYRWREIFKPI